MYRNIDMEDVTFCISEDNYDHGKIRIYILNRGSAYGHTILHLTSDQAKWIIDQLLYEINILEEGSK